MGYYYYYGFDPLYFLILISVVIAMVSQYKVKSTYSKYSRVRSDLGLTGAQAAQKILNMNGIYDVSIQHIAGDLTDNYNPRNKVLSLSDAVYNSTSIAAIGVAAHECGHAIQHDVGYAPLLIRNTIAPVVNIASSLSWIFIAAGLFFPGQVMRVMGADTVIESIGMPYTRIVLCFTPFFMMNYAFTAFVRNDNAPHIAMAATLLSSLFNIVFDYVFMFPLGMGMTGAALATAVSPIVSILICMVHYLSPKSSVSFHFMVPSVRMLISSCSLGVVAFVGEIASAVTTMVFNFVLLGLDGNTAVAAYGVIANTALVGTAIFNGVSQGLQPLASEAHARGEAEEKKKILTKSVLTGIVLTVVLIGGVWIFAPQITDVFNSEHSEQLAAYAVPGIRIYFAGFFAAAINIIFAGFLSATDHAKESSIVAITRGIVAIIAFALILPKFLGITGVWLAFPAAEVLTLFVALVISKKN